MHPEIYRELTSQRGREMREQAQRASLARTASRLRRAARRGSAAGAGDGFIMPAIPDYVDGSFRAEVAGVAGTDGDDVASQPGTMPTARRAA
jgi:hypothetical protein